MVLQIKSPGETYFLSVKVFCTVNRLLPVLFLLQNLATRLGESCKLLWQSKNLHMSRSLKSVIKERC